MRVLLGWLLLAIVVAGVGTGAVNARPAAGPPLEGSWSGTLGRAPDQRWLVVKIRRAADGRLAGSITGLDQANPTIAIDTIEQSGTSVRFVVGEVGGGFEGTLSGDGTRITGSWSELAIVSPLELDRATAEPVPPPPSAPSH